MYLRELVSLGCGPITSFELRPSFSSVGLPLPTVLVGENGSGKTTILSLITDALFEHAAHHFEDVAIRDATSRRYYRLIGGITRNNASSFELNLATFSTAGGNIRYISKSGTISASAIEKYNSNYPEISNFSEENSKKLYSADCVKNDIDSGCYFSMSANRTEVPSWQRSQTEYAANNFGVKIQNQLGKQVIVGKSLDNLRPWLVDIFLDSSLLPTEISGQSAINIVQRANEELANGKIITALVKVVSIIMKKDKIQLLRSKRGEGKRRITIGTGGEAIIPSLDDLSDGQMSLLNMFSTILRYGDRGFDVGNFQDIEGIVCIDEIDAHLHPDLQYRALPQLIRMFPKIQFFVTAHSPLFALGMEAEFGEDGFDLVQAPEGRRVPMARYRDFERAFEIFESTKVFEGRVRERSLSVNKPIVLCEGETDPPYLRAAANALGYTNLFEQAEIDWVGTYSEKGAQGGGKSQLTAAGKFLMNNPVFAPHEVVLLYDFDASQQNADIGRVHIRSVIHNPDNPWGGIENCLPIDIISDEFCRSETSMQGSARVTREVLNKKALCSHVCGNMAPHVAEKFRETLDVISAALGIDPNSNEPENMTH